MNRKQLLEFRMQVHGAILDREHVGDYNADSKHILSLLRGMLTLTDHAIEQLPRPEKKRAST